MVADENVWRELKICGCEYCVNIILNSNSYASELATLAKIHKSIALPFGCNDEFHQVIQTAKPTRNHPTVMRSTIDVSDFVPFILFLRRICAAFTVMTNGMQIAAAYFVHAYASNS